MKLVTFRLKKKLVVYVQYVKQNKVCVSYLGNRRVTDCSAEGIKNALCGFLTEKHIIENNNYSKLMGLGTDGVAVMVGRHNGLGAKLKRENPELVQVHCIAHRLNLAASQASRGVDYLEDYKRYIKLLHDFYADSQPRHDNIRELQSLLHGEVRQIPEGTSVRWLSVEAAVRMIYKFYDSIILSLEDDKDSTGKAKGIWLFLSTSLFILITALLVDILTNIGILSLTFQKDSVNIGSIRTNVNTTITTLQGMRQGSDTVDTVFRELGQPGAQGDATSTYMNVQIQDNQNLRRRFESMRSKFIDNLVENLNSRFPRDELDILESFDNILNPKRYPENKAALRDYGNENLETLCNHFSTVVNKDRCIATFLQFKHLAQSFRLIYNFEQFVAVLLADNSHVYEDLVKLVTIGAIIPVSSAPCERGFSHQNVLKSKVRNRLNPERLDRMLMLRLVGPRLQDMDFLGVCRAFGNMKERRK